MITISNTNELIHYIEQNKFAIFGTGYVAKRFYNALKKTGMDKNLLFFINSEGSTEPLFGLPVYKVDNLQKDTCPLICIAVHESIRDEIINQLAENGIDNYIWIYPYLFNLMIGNPIEVNRKVAIADIWLANRDDYTLAARYLAMDEYYKKNDYGFDIYIKMISLYSQIDTAKSRLEQFIRLLDSYEKNGMDESKRPLLYEDYLWIDGAHRITMASYHDHDFICCDIYEKGEGTGYDPLAVFSKNVIADKLDSESVRILEEMNLAIAQKYSQFIKGK